MVFVASDVADKRVFKSSIYGYHSLFAAEAFKQMLEEFSFTGLEFDADLAGVF
jgi:hypothetical protein